MNVFVIEDPKIAIVFCVTTMLGWGSWANTQKLAGKDNWPFPLYYWDFTIGIFVFSLALAATLGSSGSTGMHAIDNLLQADPGHLARAMWSGMLFNVANIFLVVAIDHAGMSVVFPVGVGLALVIGTFASYWQAPKGNPLLLFSGVLLVLTAMALSAMAYRKLPRVSIHGWAQGLVFAGLAGCLMGFFYPQLFQTLSPEFHFKPIQAGRLTPYVALTFFAVGVVSSNVIVSTMLMKLRRLTYKEYLTAGLRLHSLGLLGGILWMLALSCNLVASGVAGPAISYALGQGATLVAAIWGVFIWREFRSAPAGTTTLLAFMFFSYTAGLALIGMATFSSS